RAKEVMWLQTRMIRRKSGGGLPKGPKLAERLVIAAEHLCGCFPQSSLGPGERMGQCLRRLGQQVFADGERRDARPIGKRIGFAGRPWPPGFAGAFVGHSSLRSAGSVGLVRATPKPAATVTAAGSRRKHQLELIARRW